MVQECIVTAQILHCLVFLIKTFHNFLFVDKFAGITQLNWLQSAKRMDGASKYLMSRNLKDFVAEEGKNIQSNGKYRQHVDYNCFPYCGSTIYQS